MSEDDANSFILGSTADQSPNSVDSEPMDFTFSDNADSSASTSGNDREKSLEYADELTARGSKAAEEGDFTKAVVYYRDALEIRVAHFGELAPDCIDAYYKYGCALLNKVRAVKGDAEVLAHGDQEKPEWYLSWDMLNTAKKIVEEHSGETTAKVEILSALAEVTMEREVTEISLNRLLEALSILQQLAEPDSVLISEVNIRISECLKRLDEAVSYADMALSVYESRLEHLTKELENMSGQLETLTTSESSQTFETSSSSSQSGPSLVGKEAEIRSKLQKMLKDLQEQFSGLMTCNTSIKSALEEAAEEVKVDEENAVSVAMSSTEMDTNSTGGNIESTGHTDGASNAQELRLRF